MTAGNGDTLEATEAGTIYGSLKDENGFTPAQGTLTFTGGTGRFSHARGVLSVTAILSPTSVGVKPGTERLMAFYLVQGNMSFPEKD